MARLIVKSPYIKGGDGGGGPGGYLKYIGTREGVELLPSGYMEYMAERPRSHGLFSDEDTVDMNAAMKELNLDTRHLPQAGGRRAAGIRLRRAVSKSDPCSPQRDRRRNEHPVR